MPLCPTDRCLTPIHAFRLGIRPHMAASARLSPRDRECRTWALRNRIGFAGIHSSCQFIHRLAPNAQRLLGLRRTHSWSIAIETCSVIGRGGSCNPWGLPWPRFAHALHRCVQKTILHVLLVNVAPNVHVSLQHFTNDGTIGNS
jgi:hypothetical protein